MSKAKQHKPNKLAVSKEAFLYIPSDIYGEILGHCVGCSVEISGMGQLKPYKNGYMVTKIHTPKQECTSVETEMDDDELGVLEYECEEGKYAKYGDLTWWWHSHVDMGVFWSSTDHEAIKQLSAKGRVIATVFNRKFEMRTAYRQGASEDGFYPAMFTDNLTTVIVPSKAVEAIIIDKVKEAAKPVYHQPNYYNTAYIGSKPKAWNNPALGVGRTIEEQLDDMEPNFMFQDEPVTLTVKDTRYSNRVTWLMNDFDLSEEAAEDIMDDLEDTLGREAYTYNEIKQYVKQNYAINDEEE